MRMETFCQAMPSRTPTQYFNIDADCESMDVGATAPNIPEFTLTMSRDCLCGYGAARWHKLRGMSSAHAFTTGFVLLAMLCLLVWCLFSREGDSTRTGVPLQAGFLSKSDPAALAG